jgi:predicted TPR repeat methyltransferase
MDEPSIEQIFEQALEFHESGRLQEAEQLCREILRRQPDDGDAMHMLGIMALQKGQHEAAADLIGQAITLMPTDPDAHCNLGTALQSMGKPHEAIAAYRQAIALDPDLLRAQSNLGILLAQTGLADQAIPAFQRAVAIDPNFMFAHYNLGNALLEKGEMDAAIVSYRRAIGLKGDFAYAHLYLGNALGSKGLLEEAIAAFRQALALDPGLRTAHNNLGSALRKVGRLDEAIAVYQQGIAAHPQAVECFCGLGSALIKKKLLKEAADVYRQAIALDGNCIAAHRGLAKALELQGDIPAVIAAFKAAREVAADPSNHDYELAALGVGNAPPASPRNYIVTLFNDYAQKFDQHLQNLNYIAPQLLFDAVSALGPPQPMDIIDLGSGTGMCGELFRPMARKLVGVDLAPKMIEMSRERGIYDHLMEQDITVALLESPGQFDLIVAADVFIYVGDLDEVFQAARTALRPGGLLAFSIESVDRGDYVLRSSRRYAQSLEYIRRLASHNGFKEVSIQDAVIRNEGNLPVMGKIIVLQSAEG